MFRRQRGGVYTRSFTDPRDQQCVERMVASVGLSAVRRADVHACLSGSGDFKNEDARGGSPHLSRPRQMHRLPPMHRGLPGGGDRVFPEAEVRQMRSVWRIAEVRSVLLLRMPPFYRPLGGGA